MFLATERQAFNCLDLSFTRFSLSSTEFSEAAAASLFLPSPACKERLGEPIIGRGSKIVDEFGDNIQYSSLQGDHWRQRHDQVKFAIFRLCWWAGITVG